MSIVPYVEIRNIIFTEVIVKSYRVFLDLQSLEV